MKIVKRDDIQSLKQDLQNTTPWKDEKRKLVNIVDRWFEGLEDVKTKGR